MPRLGSGERFAALARKVGSKKLAAYIGRKKYGAKGMAALSHKGEAGADEARRAARARSKGRGY